MIQQSDSSKSKESILIKTFGYDAFRSSQGQIIDDFMNGHDVLVVMPTGGGKSICYQIPAILSDGIGIVISPLIALMTDQVEGLRQNGVKAAALHSGLSKTEQNEIFQLLATNQLDLLYLSPERTGSSRFFDYLKSLSVSFFAVDESHCVSIWGNDFRPDYLHLKKCKAEFPNIPVMALTATADEATRQDIVEQLDLESPKRYVDSFERENIHISTLPAHGRINVISDFIFDHPGESGIIYCLSRKSTESIAEKLQKKGYNAQYYHAGMNALDRTQVQQQFQNDQIDIICATIAFGMGIDKPNIRWVIHYNMPKNIESYYQEIGRAGRDGDPSNAILFSNYNDYTQLKQFIDNSPANDDFKRVQYAKLDRMWEFASSYSCQTNFILNYFGEYRNKPCGHCDNCENPPESFDGTKEAQMALSAIYRLHQNEQTDTVIDVLRGSGKSEVFQKGYQNIKTYGVGRNHKYLDWKSYIVQLINQGYIKLDFKDHSKLKLTSNAKSVLFDGQKVSLVQFEKSTTKKAKKKTKNERKQDGLYDVLKNWRMEKSQKLNIPAYTVLHNQTLEEIAAEKPTFSAQLLNMHGIGQAKMDKYGEEIIEVIQKYIATSDMQVKGKTLMKTLEYVKEGLAISEIAAVRELSESTITNHIAKLIAAGEKVDYSIYVEPMLKESQIDVIVAKWQELDFPDERKAIKESLPEFDYSQIELAIAVGSA